VAAAARAALALRTSRFARRQFAPPFRPLEWASSTPDFVEAVAPKVAVVSAGEANPFGHPAVETVERYAQAGVRLSRWRRDRDDRWTGFDGDNIRGITSERRILNRNAVLACVGRRRQANDAFAESKQKAAASRRTPYEPENRDKNERASEASSVIALRFVVLAQAEARLRRAGLRYWQAALRLRSGQAAL